MILRLGKRVQELASKTAEAELEDWLLLPFLEVVKCWQILLIEA